MADEKVTALTALTAPTDSDVLYVVDVSDTTDDPAGTSKQITRGDLLSTKPGKFSISGSQNLTTTEATLVFDTEDFDPDANYANTSGEITVTDAGYYHVSVCMPVNADSTSGGTRTAVRMWVQQDAGTGTWSNSGIFSQDYHRESSGGSGNAMAGIVSLSAGEAIRVRHDNTGSTDTSTETGETSLSIFKIREA